ncbi:DUF1800 family protein [Pseudoalteromonas carrageenovora]|uniref:DUF1800 domain-containing protein n=1 Tax=Pseudoalteromonas carrageenovora TaxID=227 RepID=UPI0026E1EDBC|nr:DUF1800 family protein [Pseudoalteromonas carrageenovora]MDO6636151.1 DUF1800 family protein [Pseudoalteromonas carrageenovora]MDO6648479.1 DUF1800 family protein [Pseudoalteromonas carrageenovora]
MHYKISLIASSIFILSACGGSGSDDTPTINGNKIPILSVADIPNEIAKGQTIELSATASDKDGTISSVVWQQTSGTVLLNEPIEATSATITIEPALSYKPINYSFSVTATDNEGATNTQVVSFTARNSMSDYSAARLLHQGSMGPTLAEIQSAKGLSEQQWLDKQIALPVNYHRDYLVKLDGEDGFRYINRIDAWWKGVMQSDDQLRQRVAFALSEILVVSDENSGLSAQPEGMITYYDLLLKHAFGNYRDLLEDVTLSPIMGTYLSHLGNEKADEALNIRPDENYAREVMQLFTIGLEELNLDGSAKLDAQGNTIATYGQTQIEGFARVFTGWTFAGSETFKRKSRDYINPMQAFSEYHSSEQKNLLNDEIIPQGYGPEESLKIALDNLFNHDNVAPFISKQLIQRLITSNPTPQYVERVASVFNDNGAGVRGDLSAVIKAIYLDDEARHFGSVLSYQGKIKEPILKTVQFWRNLDAKSLEGYYKTWNLVDSYGQGPLQSASVFNFFRPDYQTATLRSESLVAPELQIANDATLIGTMNSIFSTLVWSTAEAHSDLNSSRIYVYIQNDMNYLQQQGISELLAQYNTLYFAGSMSDNTRQALLDLDAYFNEEQYRERVSYLLYMIAISPEFNVQY